MKTPHGGGEDPPWEQRNASLRWFLSIVWSLLGFGGGLGEKMPFFPLSWRVLSSLQSLLDSASSRQAQHPATTPGAKGPACEKDPAGKHIKKEGENEMDFSCCSGLAEKLRGCLCLERALGRPAELLWLFQGFYTLGGGGLAVFVLLNLPKTQSGARREERAGDAGRGC